MRRFGIGLMMAVSALMAASASYAKDKDASATELPPLLTAGNIPCTLTDSKFVGEGTGSDKIHAKYYEAACKEGMGYVVIVKDKVPTPDAYDCFSMAQPGPDGKPGSLACKLPANLKPMDGLQALATKAGHPCAVTNARLIGSAPDKTFVELACQGGSGYILGFARHTGGDGSIEFSCTDPNAHGNLACTLTDPAKMLAATVDSLVAASGKTCTVKDRRYVGTTTDGVGIYEVACDGGKGWMIETQGDTFKQAIDCIAATNIAGGCTMTDTRAAQTAQSALYTSIAKKAGFDCNVSGYEPFDTTGGGKEVVELQCSNRPDDGVGVFPLKGGTAMVYDCIRAEAEGYRCTPSAIAKESVLYPKYSAELKALGKGSCVVSGARAFGATDATDLVEVACADGGSGWVMEYAKTGSAAPHILPCAAATQNGGCQLPTNKRK